VTNKIKGAIRKVLFFKKNLDSECTKKPKIIMVTIPESIDSILCASIETPKILNQLKSKAV
jgi:hypothetical protein